MDRSPWVSAGNGGFEPFGGVVHQDALTFRPSKQGFRAAVRLSASLRCRRFAHWTSTSTRLRTEGSRECWARRLHGTPFGDVTYPLVASDPCSPMNAFIGGDPELHQSNGHDKRGSLVHLGDSALGEDLGGHSG